MKGDLQIATGDEGKEMKVKNRTVVLTDASWIEVKLLSGPAPPFLPPPGSPALVSDTRIEKKHKPLLEIHSVECEPLPGDGSEEACAKVDYPFAFRIHFFSGSASNKARQGLNKMKRLLSVKSSFDDFLKSKLVRCHSREERDQWLLVLQRLLRDRWQAQFESSLLPAPEVYTRHAFVIKSHNDRLLLLSTDWLYNVEVTYKPTCIRGMKWSIPVSSLRAVRTSQPDHLPTLAIDFDETEAKAAFDAHHRSNKGDHKELRNKLHEFVFRTQAERERFVKSIAANYWQITRKRLKVENN